MPILLRLCPDEISQPRLWCFTFLSVGVLSWGIFLICVSVTYKDSLVWKEVCLFVGSSVSSISFISLLVFLEILLTKEMCCFQKHFQISDPENSALTEVQIETTNQNASNTVRSNWIKLPPRCENGSSVTVAETYSNDNTPSTSTIPAHLDHHTEESERHELGLQSQPILMLLHENNFWLINSSKMNASVPDMAKLIPQQNTPRKFAPNIPSVSFERAPVMKSSSSQDIVSDPYKQRKDYKRNAGISNAEYMATIETSLNNCDEIPLYENVQPLLPSNKMSQITLPKELTVSDTSSPKYFNVEEMIGNMSPKNINLSDKSKPRHFHKETRVENTIFEDLALSSITSPIFVNQTSKVESTIPKRFVPSSMSSSRYVNVKATVENTIPKALARKYECSPLYVNVVPNFKNIFSEDTGNSDTSSPRSKLI